ncbi:MAG: M23 family metallopeptidase [Clostridia bacterium]|nr:M23 family metallopeptidase [Clostridia bacterium]
MKYKRRKTNLTQYTSYQSESDMKHRKRIIRAKRRLVSVIVLGIISLSLMNPASKSNHILYRIASFPSNESDLFAHIGNYVSNKLSFLSSIGKSGSEFFFDYLRSEEGNVKIAHAGDVETSAFNDELSESSAQIESHTEDIFNPIIPCDGQISSPFGQRMHPLNGEITYHNGVDIAANDGDVIMAIDDGVVETAEYNAYSGNYIIIRHNDSITSSYAHLSKLNTRPGEEVNKGDIIGYVGSTGLATGPHLHLEIRHNGEPVNPQEYFSQG